jgi:hypothetical protein
VVLVVHQSKAGRLVGQWWSLLAIAAWPGLPLLLLLQRRQGRKTSKL